MISFQLTARLGESGPFFWEKDGKRQELSDGETVCFSFAEQECLILRQDGPKTLLQKLLIAVAVFLTAPLQIVYQYFSDTSQEDVIPYRAVLTLCPKKSGACTLYYRKNPNGFSPPNPCVSDPEAAELTCEFTPGAWRYAEELFWMLSRLISGFIWLTALLLYLGVSMGNSAGLGICVAFAMGLALLCGYGVLTNIRKCKHLRETFENWDKEKAA